MQFKGLDRIAVEKLIGVHLTGEVEYWYSLMREYEPPLQIVVFKNTPHPTLLSPIDTN